MGIPHRRVRRDMLPIAVLVVMATTILSGPSAVLAQGGDEVDLSFDFESDAQGWMVGFADLPVDYDNSIYELDHQHRTLPDGLEGSGIYVQGHNRSDDLFVFLKRRVDGLKPNTTYAVSVSIDLATNVSAGLIGIGGSPGESVFVKAGASTVEPLAKEDGNRYLRMNSDKGNQSRGGESMVVLGNVAHPGVQKREYRIKALNNGGLHLSVTTDSEGAVWLIVGTDSGFEGLSGLYYDRIAYTLSPVPVEPPSTPRTGGYGPPLWALALIGGFSVALAGLGIVVVLRRRAMS
ncbi:MAG: PEP-CTERM sorting domain-containing protein [Chloroflexi bacterium]|nr:PEP-CTERM sorting domain-containing protein [Chloroflexota bacterium]